VSESAEEQTWAAALAALRAGEVVAFPTETVYGLGADATRAEAVRKIFALKGRPADHPLIVHLLDASWLDDYALDPPPLARRLAERFWPGPLSLVLRRPPSLPHAVTGGLETVALRAPSHPVAQRLLRELGRPLAAPSANRFGRVSPTTAAHVRDEFGDELVVLDGGACEVGVESTILDLSDPTHPRLLRPGGVTREQLLEALEGLPLGGADAAAPRVPGSLESHYAPRARVDLVLADELAAACARAIAQGERVGVLANGDAPEGTLHRRLGDDQAAMAQGLYAALRALDDLGCTQVFAVLPPERGVAAAVADRLRRAAAPRPPE